MIPLSFWPSRQRRYWAAYNRPKDFVILPVNYLLISLNKSKVQLWQFEYDEGSAAVLFKKPFKNLCITLTDQQHSPTVSFKTSTSVCQSMGRSSKEGLNLFKGLPLCFGHEEHRKEEIHETETWKEPEGPILSDVLLEKKNGRFTTLRLNTRVRVKTLSILQS